MHAASDEETPARGKAQLWVCVVGETGHKTVNKLIGSRKQHSWLTNENGMAPENRQLKTERRQLPKAVDSDQRVFL